MKEIKKIIICGIGAIGTIYADKIHTFSPDNLKILVDKNRLKKYQENPIKFNNKKLNFNYILPENTDFKADLIIIATKFNGLEDAIKNIKNFIKDDTIILSLLNGITSENIIASIYGWDKLLYSYFIGHSAIRIGNNITQDGVNTIFFGSKDNDNKNIKLVKDFFDKTQINYKIPNDIIHSMWLKYILNISSNQPSAILKMTFGEMQNNSKFKYFMKHIIEEVVNIAKAEGVKNTEKLYDEAIKLFNSMTPEGKTSMLQDIEAGRETELKMFATTIVDLGKKHNIPTPYNIVIKEIIEIIHENIDKQSKVLRPEN